MTDYGDLLEGGTLRFIRVLPGPIERVWAYLTEPEKRALWFAGGITSSSVGGKAEFHFNHNNLSDHDDPFPDKYKDMEGGIEMEGKVMAFNPPHLLTLFWPGAATGEETEVTFRLSAERGEVRLELLHERISKADDIFTSSAGWHGHLTILQARLNGEAPGPFWTMHERLSKDYETRFSGLTQRLYSR